MLLGGESPPPFLPLLSHLAFPFSTSLSLDFCDAVMSGKGSKRLVCGGREEEGMSVSGSNLRGVFGVPGP
jgi:hypothetical protein